MWRWYQALSLIYDIDGNRLERPVLAVKQLEAAGYKMVDDAIGGCNP